MFAESGGVSLKIDLGWVDILLLVIYFVWVIGSPRRTSCWPGGRCRPG